MEFKTGILKNNTRYVINKNDCLKTIAISFLYNVGSNWEYPEVNGLAHFIEHLFFKGTKNRSQIQISQELEKYGVQINAFTSNELTCYYVEFNKKYLDPVLEILSDIIRNSTFSSESIEKERHVVINELNQRYSNPEFILNTEFYKHYYKGLPIAKPVIGKPYLIKKFNRFKVLAYIDQYYNSKNMVISVSGGYENNKTIINKLEEYFGKQNRKTDHDYDSTFFKNEVIKLKKYYDQWQKIFKSISIKPQNQKKIHHIYKKDLKHTFVKITFPAYSSSDPKRYPVSLLASILGSGMSSRLFNKIRNQHGLVYQIGAYNQIHDRSGYLSIHYSCNHNPKEQLQIFEIIKNELETLKNELIQDEEFNKILERKKNQIETSYDNPLQNTMFYGLQLLKENEVESYQETLKKYSQYTPNDLKIYAQQIFDFDKIFIIQISPIRTKYPL